MVDPMCYTIADIESALKKGPPYPVDPSLHLIYPSAGSVDSGSIKTTRDPLSLPDSMLLMIFPEACARHATLGSILRGYHDRTWLLKLQEADLVTGGYIAQVEKAVEEMIRERHPKVIFLCGTCIDQLLGSDYDSLAVKLEQRWGIRFGAAYMEPMMKDQRMPFKSRDLRALHSVIRSDPQKSKMPWANFVGRVLPLSKNSEMPEVLRQAGIERILHFAEAQTLEQLDEMSRSILNIGIDQRAKLACMQMERRHKIPYVLLESSLLPDVIHENYKKLGKILKTELDDSVPRQRVEQEIEELKPRLKGLKIAVGEYVQRRPFAAALELAKLGFPIDCVFTLSIQPEDLKAVEELQQLCPQCRVRFTGTPEILPYLKNPEQFDMVIGLHSHYYAQTPETISVSVNLRYGDYDSIISFLNTIKAELEKHSKDKGIADSLNKNSMQNQRVLRNQLRQQALRRAREKAPNACLKSWGVYREVQDEESV